MFHLLVAAAFVCALFPAVLFCLNLNQYSPPPSETPTLPMVSILIPARDEATSIGAAIASVLATRGVAFELIVMDDSSADETASIVQAVADRDARLRLEHAPLLPRGWNGKQHTCWALSHVANGEVLCFLDADVRIAPDAIARMAGFLLLTDSALVSGFPRQITKTWAEWMLLPLIHFVLLGFLPMRQMRAGKDPVYAAGCGQFMMVRRDAYFEAGGHAAVRRTMHDGVMLPKLFRRHGYRTDLADLTGLATCRMYTDARQVWQGLAKNATEGLATPMLIVPISLFFLFGQVLPFGLTGWLFLRGGASTLVAACVLVSLAGAWSTRFLAVGRFQHDWRGALLHPFGIVLLLGVQWYAFSRKLFGGAVSWRKRSYVEQE